MTLLEARVSAPERSRERRGVRTPVAWTSAIRQRYVEYNGMHDETPGVNGRLRRILKATEEVRPAMPPKKINTPKGVKLSFRSHSTKPQIVYATYMMGDVMHFHSVIIYDGMGRPTY